MRKIFLILLSFSLLASPLNAERIYKHVDADGNVSFSSKPPFSGAKPAKLPEITRGEMKLVDNPLETCSNHGGINCDAGPTATGTVKCLDGYTGAAARFVFSCSSAKLEIAQVGDPAEEDGFSVMIRNMKSIKAKKPELYLKRGRKEIALIGPSEIEGYGVAEFVLDMKDVGSVTAKPRKKDFRVLCTNCS